MLNRLPLFVSGDVSPSVREELETHLGCCAACASELAGMREIESLLHLAGALPLPRAEGASIEARVREAIAAESHAASADDRGRWWIPLGDTATLFFKPLLAAAAFLFAFGLGLFVGQTRIGSNGDEQTPPTLTVRSNRHAPGTREELVATPLDATPLRESTPIDSRRDTGLLDLPSLPWVPLPVEQIQTVSDSRDAMVDY